MRQPLGSNPSELNAAGLNAADPELTSALATFSAMITPAVLILACSSLVLATSGRLARTLDRARSLLHEYQLLSATSAPRSTIDATHVMLMDQLGKTTHRAKLLQLAMTFLYTALASFVMTSVLIGLDALIGESWAIYLVLLGLIGVSLLLTSAVLLILESRVALQAVQSEMKFVREMARLSQSSEVANQLRAS